MVRQITGDYRVKSEDLLPLYEEALMLLLRIENWQIRHIPREENRRADELCNKAVKNTDKFLAELQKQKHAPPFTPVGILSLPPPRKDL